MFTVDWLAGSLRAVPFMSLWACSESDIETEDGEIGGPALEAADN